MKIKALTVLFVILMMAAQPVSAGFFDDFVAWTGNVLSFQEVGGGEGGGEAPAPEPAPAPQPEPIPPAPEPMPPGPEPVPPEPYPVPQEPPQERRCDTFRDPAGCAVTKCTDGFYEQKCPERPAPQPGICYVGEQQVPCPQPTQPQPAPQPGQPQPGQQPSQPMPQYDNYLMPGPEREKCESEGGMATFGPNGRQVCIYPQQDVSYGGKMQKCERFIDDKGMMRVQCWEGEEGPQQPVSANCPPIDELQRKKQGCKEGGGMPIERVDQRGCTFFDCTFEGEGGGGNFLRPGECPSQEERDTISQKCGDMGMTMTIIKEGSCLIAKCGGEEQRPGMGPEMGCPEDNPAFRKQKKDECLEKQGGTPFQNFDERGCPITVCEVRGEGGFEEEYCAEKPPMEAYMGCQEGGGELIVKTDDRGCVKFTKCVMRGDENTIEYDDVQVGEVPSAAKLLSVAMKLEDLKIEFDKLARKTESIAQYYESVGDETEAARFYKVAGMFDAAKGKVDEIKNKLRERVRDIQPQDLMEIKHDVKYISDVIMEDALYVMLGTGEDFGEYTEYTEEAGGKNCYNDQECFFSHMRVCEEGTTVSPERGVTLTLKGMEGTNCILHVLADTPEGEMEMTCPYPDYAFGIDNKEKLLGYCTGPLKDFMMEGGAIIRSAAQPPLREAQPVPSVEQGVPTESREEVRYEEGGPYGIEYGRLGCNGKGSYEMAKEQCRYACEIDVPGCAPWIVCADDPTSCPPRNYCEIHPEACPKGPGFSMAMCSADDNWAFTECERRGGKPLSNPDPQRGCGIYTGCDMSVLEEKPLVESSVIVESSVNWCPEAGEKPTECSETGGKPQGKGNPELGCQMYTGCLMP